jgi:hypothetical protein
LGIRLRVSPCTWGFLDIIGAVHFTAQDILATGLVIIIGDRECLLRCLRTFVSRRRPKPLIHDVLHPTRFKWLEQIGLCAHRKGLLRPLLIL